MTFGEISKPTIGQILCGLYLTWAWKECPRHFSTNLILAGEMRPFSALANVPIEVASAKPRRTWAATIGINDSTTELEAHSSLYRTYKSRSLVEAFIEPRQFIPPSPSVLSTATNLPQIHLLMASNNLDASSITALGVDTFDSLRRRKETGSTNHPICVYHLAHLASNLHT